MMMKLFIWGALLLIVGAFGGGYFLGQGSVTGQVVGTIESEKTYTWTTAICNDQHQCIDVLVHCEQGKVVSLVPVSNLTQFSEVWNDPRLEDVVLCE